MYIIVAGCGKIGSNLAKSLSQQNHDVVVIDNNPENFDQLGSGFNGITMTGMPIDEDVLKAAGISRANALAAVTTEDNMNLMISQIAVNVFHVPKVITRVYDPEREIIFKQLGLVTMCPTTLAVEQVNTELTNEKQGIWHNFGNKGVRFEYITIYEKYLGRQIKDLFKKYHVFGIIRDTEFMFAEPDIRVSAGDTLVVAEYA